MKKPNFMKLAAITVAASTMTATASFSSFADEAHTATERPIGEASTMESVLNRLGYDNMQAVLASSSALPPKSQIKDLNGDGAADIRDALYILQFLEGKQLYKNDYSDLDVTNDYILNAADANAYMQYYAHYLAEGTPAPFSASNGSRTVDTSFEYRTYVEYDYPANTTKVYTLGASGLMAKANGISLLPEETETTATTAQAPELDADAAEAEMLASGIGVENYEEDIWTICQDSRIVRTGQINDKGEVEYQGNGFIIGDHTIAAAGHCVCNETTKAFNPYRVVWAYTFETVNGKVVPVQHQLTVTSVHVPKAYIDFTGDEQYRYDYSLITVKEDLSAYGKFDLGMLTSDAPCSSDGTGDAIMNLTVKQFAMPNKEHEKMSSYPTYRDGYLNKLNEYRFRFRPKEGGGVSGSAMYAPDLDETVVGIVNAGPTSGLAITRPLLQFYYNNPEAQSYF